MNKKKQYRNTVFFNIIEHTCFCFAPFLWVCYNAASMKICVFSDVHGNIDALNALMQSENWLAADKHIFLGDVINLCLHSAECAEKLLATDTVMLLGNHECYTLKHIHPKEHLIRSPQRTEHLTRTRQLLSPQVKQQLAALPKEYRIEWHGKTLTFTHYVWACNFMTVPGLYGNALDNDGMMELFQPVQGDYVFAGHDHFPSQFSAGQKSVICVGSVGIGKPGYYVMLELHPDGAVTWQWQTVEYNVEKVIAEMLNGTYPGTETYVDWFDYISEDRIQKRMPEQLIRKPKNF